jgi:hypothetical protein
MRFIKKLMTVYFGYLLAQIIIGCCHAHTVYYEISELKVSDFAFGDGIYRYNNEGDTIVISSNENYGYYSIFSTTYLASAITIIPSALATSCAPDEYILQNKVVDINIISFFDFNEEFLRNFESSELFKVTFWDGTIKELVSAGDILSNKLPYSIDFHLQSKPTLDEYQQFEVQFIMEDGQVLRDTTAIIHFL